MGYSGNVGLIYPLPVAVRGAGNANRDRFHKQRGCATRIVVKWRLGDQPEFLPTLKLRARVS